jgi:hypothetical protein
LTDTISTISLQESGYGRLPCAKPDGPMIGLHGQALVPVNLSAKQAKAAGLMMSGTYGPPGTGLLHSAILQLSLASKLQALLAGRGSTLYSLTWRDWATPAGRLYCALRASARRTSGTAITGWPTPDAQVMNYGADPVKHQARRDRLKEKHGNSNGAGLPLTMAAQLAAWATPATRDYRTPNHAKWSERGGGKKGEQLQNQVAHMIPGASLNGLPAATERCGLLNPAFSLWLQGIPAMWAFCAPQGTRSIRTSRKHSFGHTLETFRAVRDL